MQYAELKVDPSFDPDTLIATLSHFFELQKDLLLDVWGILMQCIFLFYNPLMTSSNSVLNKQCISVNNANIDF
jgi:hypothetical protein